MLLWLSRGNGMISCSEGKSMLTVLARLMKPTFPRISILRQSRRFYDCWPLRGA